MLRRHNTTTETINNSLFFNTSENDSISGSYHVADVYLYNSGSTDVVLNLLEQDVTDDDRTPWTYTLFIAKNSNAYHSVRCSNYDAYVTPVNTNTLESFYTTTEYCGPGSYRYEGNTFTVCPSFQLGSSYSLMYPSTFEANTAPCKNGATLEDRNEIHNGINLVDKKPNSAVNTDQYSYTPANVYVYNDDSNHDIVVNIMEADNGGHSYSAQIKSGEKHTFSSIVSSTYYAYAFPDNNCEGCSYDFIENPFFVYPSYGLVYPTLFTLNAPPTHSPTLSPTNGPTFQSTDTPTFMPTNTPTTEPTLDPSLNPSFVPTTFEPSNAPTQNPSFKPTPTFEPSYSMTALSPTKTPSQYPSLQPTPTFDPSYLMVTPSPTNSPSQEPSFNTTLTFDPTISNFISGSDDGSAFMSNESLAYGSIGVFLLLLLSGAAYFFLNQKKNDSSNSQLNEALIPNKTITPLYSNPIQCIQHLQVK
ncbi:MAG: hypothetical protein ACE365_02745 [Gammaproteobacteria bacterium]